MIRFFLWLPQEEYIPQKILQGGEALDCLPRSPNTTMRKWMVPSALLLLCILLLFADQGRKFQANAEI
ncbi:hypothetical protein K1719_033608 [Acacia pycnantha]|nr:hypothetical protein K1719_033608 [Acacia pycnantha]